MQKIDETVNQRLANTVHTYPRRCGTPGLQLSQAVDNLPFEEYHAFWPSDMNPSTSRKISSLTSAGNITDAQDRFGRRDGVDQDPESLKILVCGRHVDWHLRVRVNQQLLICFVVLKLVRCHDKVVD